MPATFQPVIIRENRSVMNAIGQPLTGISAYR